MAKTEIALLEAKINARKEYLKNYPTSYWPTNEELGTFTQEEFEEAIVHIDAKFKADQADNGTKEVVFETKQHGETVVNLGTMPVRVVIAPATSNTIQFTKDSSLFTAQNNGKIQSKTQPLVWKEETLSDSAERKFKVYTVEAPFENDNPIPFKYQGYLFILSGKLPEDTRTKIIDFIKDTIDEIPM